MIDIVTIETPSLGDRSYLVHDGTVAVVVDPQRDIDRVLEHLDRLGVRATHVFETHVHNDYVSGGPALAKATGARLVMHADDDVFADHDDIHPGDVIRTGSMHVRAESTPGHTPTHLAYVVGQDGQDVAVMTGGSMLYGTVGRTDLISAAQTEPLTRAQYRSVHHLGDKLAPSVDVMPTHGFGSFCASSTTEPDSAPEPEPDGGATTIADERATNIAFRHDEDSFVQTLIAGYDVYPEYYLHMAPSNRIGASAPDLTPPVTADPAQLAARLAAGEWVVDLRPRDEFAADHVAGTINVELSDSFITYLGWVAPWNSPLTLIAPTADDVATAQRDLVRIGIDRPAAAASGALDEIAGMLPRSSYRLTDFAGLAAEVAAGRAPVIVDARRRLEWDDSHIDGAIHLPLHELSARMDELPDGEIWVHCQSGFRASIAASLIARSGRTPVVVDGDFPTAADAGLPVT